MSIDWPPGIDAAIEPHQRGVDYKHQRGCHHDASEHPRGIEVLTRILDHIAQALVAHQELGNNGGAHRARQSDLQRREEERSSAFQITSREIVASLAPTTRAMFNRFRSTLRMPANTAMKTG